MPLGWNVDHGTRIITVLGRGTLVRQDLDEYLAAAAAEGASGYRVLFDLRAADLSAVSEVAKNRKAAGSSGAIALVVDSEAEREMAAYFVSHTTGQRLCRLFSDVDRARAWLEEEPQ